jgi:hypothetical protein
VRVILPLFILYSFIFCGGCDFNFPLGAPALPIEDGLCGRWQCVSKNSDKKDVLLVLPLSEQEYLVNYPLDADSGLYGKAWLVDIGGSKLVQLEWVGSASGEGAKKENAKRYQLLSYSINAEKLTVRLINPEFIKDKPTIPDELKAFIKANFTNEALYREPIAFRKMSN